MSFKSFGGRAQATVNLVATILVVWKGWCEQPIKHAKPWLQTDIYDGGTDVIKLLNMSVYFTAVRLVAYNQRGWM